MPYRSDDEVCPYMEGELGDLRYCAALRDMDAAKARPFGWFNEMREELAKADARVEELEALIKSLENGWRCRNEGQLSKIEDLCAELARYRDALGFLRNRTSLDHEQREIVDCALDQ